MNLDTGLRRTTIAVLLAAAGWLAMPSRDGTPGAVPESTVAPSPTASPSGTEVQRAALEQRLARYLELRLGGDWPALYELTDPQQRARVDLRRYLDAYGHGVLVVEDIYARSLQVDLSRGVARAELHTEARLVPTRLPAGYRRGLRVGSPDDLRQSLDHELPWVLRDGQWYYRMEDEIVLGVDEQGQPLRGLGAASG